MESLIKLCIENLKITSLWLVIMAFLGAECFFFFLNNIFIFCHVEDNNIVPVAYLQIYYLMYSPSSSTPCSLLTY